MVDSGSLLALSPYQHYHYTTTLGITIQKYIYYLSLAKELCKHVCSKIYLGELDGEELGHARPETVAEDDQLVVRPLLQPRHQGVQHL